MISRIQELEEDKEDEEDRQLQFGIKRFIWNRQKTNGCGS